MMNQWYPFCLTGLIELTSCLGLLNELLRSSGWRDFTANTHKNTIPEASKKRNFVALAKNINSRYRGFCLFVDLLAAASTGPVVEQRYATPSARAT